MSNQIGVTWQCDCGAHNALGNLYCGGCGRKFQCVSSSPATSGSVPSQAKASQACNFAAAGNGGCLFEYHSTGLTARESRAQGTVCRLGRNGCSGVKALQCSTRMTNFHCRPAQSARKGKRQPRGWCSGPGCGRYSQHSRASGTKHDRSNG